jgi:mannose-6-phosphate isomerase-like protein (cupin superfamily)
MNRTISNLFRIGAATAVLLGIAARSLDAAPTSANQPNARIIHIHQLFQEKNFPQILPGVRRTDLAGTQTAVVRLLQIHSIRRHIHRANTEYVYVVDGSGRVMLGDRSELVRPGDLVVIPAGVPHAFVANSGTLNLLNIASPPDTPQETTWL